MAAHGTARPYRTLPYTSARTCGRMAEMAALNEHVQRNAVASASARVVCDMGYQETIIERLGKTLHGRLDDITHEPLPRRWVDLIRHLDEQERNRPGRHDPTTKQDSNARSD